MLSCPNGETPGNEPLIFLAFNINPDGVAAVRTSKEPIANGKRPIAELPGEWLLDRTSRPQVILLKRLLSAFDCQYPGYPTNADGFARGMIRWSPAVQIFLQY
jgi:hypothetical protein